MAVQRSVVRYAVWTRCAIITTVSPQRRSARLSQLPTCGCALPSLHVRLLSRAVLAVLCERTLPTTVAYSLRSRCTVTAAYKKAQLQ